MPPQPHRALRSKQPLPDLKAGKGKQPPQRQPIHQGPQAAKPQGSGVELHAAQQQEQQQSGSGSPERAAAPARQMTELELLEAQHEADLKRVEEIRAQLARAVR